MSLPPLSAAVRTHAHAAKLTMINGSYVLSRSAVINPDALPRRDVRWYLAWRKRLPAWLRAVEAVVGEEVVARPWLHRGLLWLGGTVRAPAISGGTSVVVPCLSHQTSSPSSISAAVVRVHEGRWTCKSPSRSPLRIWLACKPVTACQLSLECA